MGTSLHAHVARESADCDGRHGLDYIITLNDEERAEHVAANGINDFHDLTFKNRVMGGVVSFDSEWGAEVRINAQGFGYTEGTDEGYTRAEVTWCEDESCDPDEGGQYDQFAEMSGY